MIVQKTEKCKCCGKTYTTSNAGGYYCTKCHQSLSVSLCDYCKTTKEYYCPKCGASKECIAKDSRGCLYTEDTYKGVGLPEEVVMGNRNVASKLTKTSNTSIIQYMAGHFAKIQNKKYELYVISKLWNDLNDSSIKFVFQQCIFLPDTLSEDDKSKFRAMADLYLPQFNMIIEIDEAHHLYQHDEDEQRTESIKKVLGQDICVERVTIYEEKNGRTEYVGDDSINKRIAQLVGKIKKIKNDAVVNGNFKDWNGIEEETSLEYHRRKGYIDVNEGSSFSNTNDVLHLYGTGKRYRTCAVRIGKTTDLLWCPKLSLNNSKIKFKDWKNTISADGEYIYEQNIIENPIIAAEKEEQFGKRNTIGDTCRITFVKDRNAINETRLRFVGVFILSDYDKETKTRTWKRIATIIKVSSQEDIEADLNRIKADYLGNAPQQTK